MSKLIAAINMTLDGFFDHTAINPDDEIHQHYADLLTASQSVLYGRITYQLMEYWKNLVKNPTGIRSMDEFATVMDGIPKIVFSNTLNSLEWESANLSNRTLEEEALELKQQSGKDILIGSRSLILQLMSLNLIDELQLCIHPVAVGGGRSLFENLNDRVYFKLSRIKKFNSGAVILYYEPGKKENL